MALPWSRPPLPSITKTMAYFAVQFRSRSANIWGFPCTGSYWGYPIQACGRRWAPWRGRTCRRSLWPADIAAGRICRFHVVFPLLRFRKMPAKPEQTKKRYYHKEIRNYWPWTSSLLAQWNDISIGTKYWPLGQKQERKSTNCKLQHQLIGNIQEGWNWLLETQLPWKLRSKLISYRSTGWHRRIRISACRWCR